MENTEEIDLLKKVVKMDAPPFLMTHIAAKIRAEEAERLPVSWQLAGGLTVVALFFLHVFLAKNETRTTEIAAQPLAVSLKIQASNQFYDE